ncbi:MmgE/PrpD family protein [Paralcaligenes sp. KSB-10]|uniref:MmgE/PrpD family protein n=1 Tax=Paralcaligenes sp. KSB-10 TaxID=2901142 RepID=UPI001E3E6E7E|nr:MmgE/PrpD family protein [Paralcaligenes sp. KSB-10]UHL63896.1 MmgE/PrpD family protein [Paralcaligenes sp. KSB-10]
MNQPLESPRRLLPGAGLAALARFTAELDLNALPAVAIDQAKACLLYGLAVAIASTKSDGSRIAAAAVDGESEGDAGMRFRATRFIDAKRISAGDAAFCNAALFHARVQEDAHPAGHVGVAVMPAALAVAQRLGVRGAELLCAVVAGYEVALRIGRDHAGDASRRGFRTTPLYGVFGAAAAAARLMRLDQGRTHNALALAANTACGLREFVNAGTEEYTLHAGFASRNGISAAYCAAAGAAAAASSLDGAAGFYQSYGGTEKRYDERIEEGLGREFEMLRVAYKPYPTCQFHRSVIHGVLTLRARAANWAPQAMTIRMNPFEADFVGVRFAGPFQTFSQTFMSAPFCAALAWTTGVVGYEGMHEFTAPAVLRQVSLVRIVSDPARPPYHPVIVLTDPDGAAQDEWGQTENSLTFDLTWDAAGRMAGALCQEAGVSDAARAALVLAIEGLEHAPSIDALIDAVNAAIAERP